MFDLLQRPHAARQLRQLRKTHHPLIKAISEAIIELANNPRPRWYRLHTATRIKDDVGIRRYRARFCKER